MNSQMKAMHRAKNGEKAQSFHVLSRYATLLNLHVFINLETL